MKTIKYFIIISFLASTIQAFAQNGVHPFWTISGSSSVCPNTEYTYTASFNDNGDTDLTANGTQAWSITGGRIVETINLNKVVVKWHTSASNISVNSGVQSRSGPDIPHNSANGRLGVTIASNLSGELGIKQITDTNGNNIISLSSCEDITYFLKTNAITEKVESSKNKLRYYWYYNNGGTPYTYLAMSNNVKCAVSLNGKNLIPSNKIKFKVEAYSVCPNIKKTSPTAEKDLKYCFENLEISVTNPTCYDSTNATITINNIPDPKDCATYNSCNETYKDYIDFTISRFVRAVKDDSGDFTCGNAGGQNTDAMPLGSLGEGFCPSGFSTNYTFEYTSSSKTLSKNEIKLYSYRDSIITDTIASAHGHPVIKKHTIKVLDDSICGINNGMYEIQIENPLFSPVTFYAGLIQTPPKLVFENIKATVKHHYKDTDYMVTTPNGNDGEIKVNIKGGTPPWYIYTKTSSQSKNDYVRYKVGSKTDTIDSFYTQNVLSLSGDTINVFVRDTNGCMVIVNKTEKIEDIFLRPPKELSIYTTGINKVLCNVDDDGYSANGDIEFEILGGIGPYIVELTYLDSNTIFTGTVEDGSFSSIFGEKHYGNYKLKVKDTNQYQKDSIETFIDQPKIPLGIDTSNILAPRCLGGNTGEITLTAIGNRSSYQFIFQGISVSNDTLELDTLRSIIYSVHLNDNNNCSTEQTFDIPENEKNAVHINHSTSFKAECKDSLMGEIQVSARLGDTLSTTSYIFYLIENDEAYNSDSVKKTIEGNNAIFDSLAAGKYSIFVEDDNNCLQVGTTHSNYKDTITVPENKLIQKSSISSCNIAEKGDSTGWIIAEFNGGAGKYIYELTDYNKVRIKTDTLTGVFAAYNLKPNKYKLFVKDTCGCKPGNWENIIEIKEPVTALGIKKDFITNPLCYGDSTGMIKVQGTGGWEDYTYYLVQDEKILDSNETGKFDKLWDGVYTVIVQDTMLASAFLIDSVNQPTELILKSVVIDSVKCYNGSDGSISLTLSGGTGSYYYSLDNVNWNNGTVVDSLNVGTGTLTKDYTINFRDANNCNDQVNVTLSQYPEVTFDFFRTVAQTGVANGAIEVEVKGGNLPYNYKWYENENGSILDTDTLVSGILAGEYQLLFEDANQCIHDIDTLKLNNKLGPVIYDSSWVQPTCNAWSDGSISFMAHEGNAPYELALIHGTNTTILSGLLADTQYQFENLEAGSYKLAIKDNWDWIGLDTLSIEIIDKELLSYNNLQVKHITKNGGIDSKIELDLFGGNNFYDYALYNSIDSLIESGQTNKHIFIDSLRENNYTLAYRDTCACANTMSSLDSILVENLQIIEPEPLIIIIDTVSMPLCYNDDNGYIEVHATGGWNNYKYRINYGSDTIFKSKSLFEYLPAGNYTIDVKDSLNVISSLTITLTQPDTFMLINTIVNDVLCYNGNDGSMHFQLQGGTFPYTLINGSEGFVNTALTELEAGPYSIYFKDANKCEITDPYIDTIVQPTDIKYTIFKREAQEELSNGSLRVEVSGGVPPYQIEWYNKDTSELLSSVDSLVNIQSDTYYLRITDSHYCEKDERYFLPKEGSPRFENITNTAITCQGYNNGKIVFNMLGVHPPYNVWLVQKNDTIDQLENLNDTVDYTFENFEPGYYTIEIRDAWNWQGRKVIFIYEPYYLFIETYKENIIVAGTNTGRIIFDIDGGNPAYKYEFINKKSGITIKSGNVGNQIIFDNLYTGQYQLYLKDTCGCTNGYDNWFSSEMVTITQPMPLQINIDQNNSPSCFGFSNGSILVSAQGGSTANGSYKYRINSSKWSISGAFKDLKADSYFIEAIDSAGTVIGETVVVSQPDLLEISATNIVTDFCTEENTSTVNLEVTGGTEPYYYSLNDISWYSGTQVNELNYGDYTIYVKDNNACTATQAQINIEKTDLLSVRFTKQTAQLGHSNGYIQAVVEGGLQTYTYTWHNSGGDLISSEALLENISTGIYWFSINDANGCNKTENVVLDAKYGPRLASVVSTVSESCKGKTDGQASFCLKDGNAQYKVEVYRENEFIQSFESINTSDTCNLSNLAAGNYTISIEDSLGWTGTGSFSIYSPDLVNITLKSLLNPSCFDYNNASIEVEASGGNGNYEYSWNTGAETKLLTNISAGTYGVTVTDMNACSETAEYTINNPELLTVDLGDDFTICSGQEYYFWTDVYNTYQWLLEDKIIGTNRSIKIDKQGSYEVIVTNENGCEATDEVYIEIRDDLLEADFLMPSVAYTTDTVVVIDISWPDAENIYWTFSEGIESINSKDYYEEIIFNNSGIFKVSLISTKGACVDSVSKFINVTDIEQEKAENTKLGAKESLIKTFTVYPNPSTGEFYVKVELREKAKVEISLLRMDNQIMINKQKSNGFEAYEFEYNLGQINHGIYILRLVVGNELRTKKLFIVN